MAGGNNRPDPSRAALCLFKMLLALYPKEFRAEFEREMVRTFRDMACEPGANLVALSWRIAVDTIVSAMKERREQMKSNRLALLVLAIGAGLAIAWVDSRPNWDDTGITALALFFTSALFGAASPRSPWVWALAVGLWIPALGILKQGNLSMLLVLLFTFAGAYLGSFLRGKLAPNEAGSRG